MVMLVHGWQHAGHEMHHSMTFAQDLKLWMLMVAAMMLPLVFNNLWVTAAGSLWKRRHRAIAGFLVGYFGPWLALGLVAAGLRELPQTHSYTVPACIFAFAAWWLTTGMHRRAVVGCHSTVPLAPLGWQADRDCIRFGAIIGGACLYSCWPLMLGCMFTGHSLIAMGGGMAVSILERRSYRPRKRAMLATTLALAIYCLVLSGFGQELSNSILR